jgi:CheY-like chemotaxis protein
MFEVLLSSIKGELATKPDSILFVDDEVICHDVVNLVLCYTTNYNIINAYSGSEALSLAKKFNKTLGLIFIDILLSDMNGYQLYNIFRQNPEFIDIPIIFQSGMNGNVIEINKLVNDKKVDIIQKPYKNDELINIVNKYMMQYK